MAKPDAPAPAAPAAPRLGPSKVANLQSIATERSEDVVNWDDRGGGESFGGEVSQGAQPRVIDDAPGQPNPGDPDFVEPVAAKPKDEPEAKDDEPAKESAAEKRARALANLSGERKARELEAKLKAANEKLGSADKMTLADILKAKGIDKDDLLEKLLTGSDGLELPPKLEGDAKTVAELKAEVAELKARDKAREEEAGQRQVQEATRVVSETLKASDDLVPLVNSVSGSHARVLTEAFTAWDAAGRPASEDGSSGMLAFVPRAAERVEKALRKEHPRLAELADKAKARPEAAAAALSTGGGGITRRAASRPNGKPAPLPDDPQERDAAIKREHGWS